jgi:hypothetical protein
MAIEEITLSVPGEESVSAENGSSNGGRSAPHRGDTAIDCDFVRGYREILRERDRFALSRRGRERRQHNFEIAFKSLVKNLAREATSTIPNRPAKLSARTRIYISLIELAGAVAEDHRQSMASARRVLLSAIGVGTIGVLGMAYTITANGWLT